MSPKLQQLLRETSRSFYLTLRVLPAAVRPQIGLAYLLARATDTIADTELVPLTERLDALDALRDRILGRRVSALDFTRLAAAQSAADSGSERRLLEQVESAVSLLNTLGESDLADLRAVLTTITGGQALDLRRFSGTAPYVTALASDAELDDYTYRVAGCVGEFWTRLTRRHCFPKARLDDPAFLADGIRFGQGLQLVNILRDLPRDLATGRCYLPAPALAAVGLRPPDLRDPANESRMRPVYDHWIRRAEAHLTAGWRYTDTLPSGQLRLRLACAWPVLLGARTLAKLRGGGVLDPARRIKVTRPEVRSLLLGSVWRLPFPSAWNRQFAEAIGTTDGPR